MTAGKSAILFLFLGICSYTDIRKKVICVKCLPPFFLTGLILAALSGKEGLISAVLGMAAGLFILLISFITNGAVGSGDALALMVTGVFLGVMKNTELLCLSLFISAVFSAAALISGRCGRKTELPFLPFILAAHFLMTAMEYAGLKGGLH